MSAQPELPPFRVIREALRKTTERLATELQEPGAAPPEWSDFEWTAARAASAMQGISVLLANRLRWQGPRQWQTFMHDQRRFSIQCDARLAALLVEIDGALRAAAVSVVGLKGTSLRTLGLYAPGERPMGDVDLLARPEDLPRITQALASIDYEMAFELRRHAVFAPRRAVAAAAYGEHPDNPLKIEVHTCVAEHLPASRVDISERLMPGCMSSGTNYYRDDPALLLHLLLHAAGNMRAHALRQIQLHDIALLARRLPAADWSQLTNNSDANGGRWWLLPPLSLTERYYPGSVPAAVLRALSGECPLPLRIGMRRQTLTAVSWSNLRIHAFPGIVWSRTPFDALRFARSRLLPDRTARSELELGAIARPQSDVRWYRASHPERIVRWLFTRPPRVQTISAVAAALRADVP